jgi:hypothetical protein
MNNAKLVESTEGTAEMTDGTRRTAYMNTYRVTKFNADGTFSTEEITRIEFRLFTNANTNRSSKFRKASFKQAATFAQD